MGRTNKDQKKWRMNNGFLPYDWSSPSKNASKNVKTAQRAKKKSLKFKNEINPKALKYGLVDRWDYD